MKTPAVRSTGNPKVGEQAPNFSLLDQKGERHSLNEYRSEWVVVYFFSARDAEMCSPENCPLRDDFTLLKQRRVYVMGVSPLSVEENYQFAKEYGVSVRLLSDHDRRAAKIYGTWGKRPDGDREDVRRNSFLVNPQGMLVKIYADADPRSHAKDVMVDLMKIPETQSRRVAPEDMKIPGMPERRFTLD